ncbi:hypothetical protein RE428_25940 [Marinobacter nanhaiticus D15-8W]|nr:hypothetical protein RE428_25940 [Marinobacter nanhaiticus D15-8W]
MHACSAQLQSFPFVIGLIDAFRTLTSKERSRAAQSKEAMFETKLWRVINIYIEALTLYRVIGERIWNF